MHTVTSFPAATVPRDQLNAILTDYLALDRARIFRRLLVARFGALALLALVLSAMVNSPSSYLVRALAVAVCLVPPGWAWIAEWRLAQRLTQRLAGVPGVTDE